MKIKRLLVPATITLTFSVISVVKAQESPSEPAGTVTSGALGNVPAKAQELPLKLAVIDTDKDGKITKDELVAFVQKRAKDRVEVLFQKLDVNGDGFITADEIQGRKIKLEDVDADKDGKVSKDELVGFAQKKAKERAERRFKELDVNGDGFVTADELRRPKQNEKKAKNEEGAEKEEELF